MKLRLIEKRTPNGIRLHAVEVEIDRREACDLDADGQLEGEAIMITERAPYTGERVEVRIAVQHDGEDEPAIVGGRWTGEAVLEFADGSKLNLQQRAIVDPQGNVVD